MKIFKVILKTGIYPKSWKESFTIPIYKSGDKNDPNNYRGVSLINCLPKIFNTLLNNRLIKIIEDQLSNSLFGFRENHRTADTIFVLKSLINKYIHKNKKKIYACFVDLRKAFDSVWREALLYKLCKMGVGLHIFKLLKEQNLNTTSSLKHKDQHLVFFNISMGVKQVDSLRDRPFNLKGGLWFFVSFRIIFSDITKSYNINFFCRAKREIFFRNLTFDYMTKTLNQIIFFPPPKSENVFQQHLESEYFFRKKL